MWDVRMQNGDRSKRPSEQEILRKSKVLDGINRIFREALSTETEEQLGAVCLAVAEEITESRFGFMGEIGREGRLNNIAISNNGKKACSIRDGSSHQVIPTELEMHGIYGRVFLDGKSLYTNAPAEHPDSIGTPSGHPPLTAFLGAPLIRENATIGVMAMANRPGGYTDEQAEDLEALAPAVVEALSRKRAEEALRESEERFRAFVTASSDVVYRMSPDWTEMRQLHGMSFVTNEEPGRTWLKRFILADDRQYVTEAIHRAVREKSIFELEHRFINLDGTVGWRFSRAIPLLNEKGEIVEWFGSASDITERKRAEEALRQSEQRLAIELSTTQLLQRLSTKLIQADRVETLYDQILDTAITIVRADFASIHKLHPGSGTKGRLKLLDFRGFDEWAVKFWEWVPPTSQSACNLALRAGERVAVPDVTNCNFMNGSDDLEAYLQSGIIAVQTTPLMSRTGRLLGVFSTHWREPHELKPAEMRALDILARQAADLLERLETEKDLRRSREELEMRVQERTAELVQKTGQLRALAGELTLAEQRERQRLAHVLHDGLQQLLVGAKYRLDFESRGRNVHSELIEISKLIEDAIEISRSLTAELSPTVLLQGDLVLALKWLSCWMHDKHGLDTGLTTRKKIDRLSQDVILLLFQSARELLFNVVKHAGVESATVTVDQADGEFSIVVEDEGTGFDSEQLRAKGGRAGGMGLFSISERLSHMGGRLHIDSAPGRGSRFKLSVPCSRTTAEADGQATDEPFQASVAAPSHGIKRIRVVLADDHPLVRQGLAGLLRSEPEIEIVGEASDGNEAIEAAGELRPDVILMDVSMPGIDGIEAARIIHQEHPGIRIIGLSMFDAKEKEAAMRRAGAVDYVTKSGPSEILVEAVRASVRIGG